MLPVTSSRIHAVGLPGWRRVVLLVVPYFTVFHRSLFVLIRIWSDLCDHPWASCCLFSYTTVGVPGWRCVALLIFPLLAVYYSSLIVFIRIWNGLRTYRCILLVVSSRIHAVSVDAVSLPWYFNDLLFTIAHSSSLSGVASYTPCWLFCIHIGLRVSKLSVTLLVVPWFTVYDSLPFIFIWSGLCTYPCTLFVWSSVFKICLSGCQ